jgi:hypothetical protein
LKYEQILNQFLPLPIERKKGFLEGTVKQKSNWTIPSSVMIRNFKEALEGHKHIYELVTAWFGRTLNVDQIIY